MKTMCFLMVAIVVLSSAAAADPASAPYLPPSGPNIDLNGDGRIDFLDTWLFSLSWYWGVERAGDSGDSGKDYLSFEPEMGDLNQDGKVNREDAAALSTQWKKERVWRLTATSRPTAEPTITPTKTFTPTFTPTPTVTPTPTSPYVIISGTVRAEDGTPVSGAVIMISGITAYSGVDGSYSIRLYGPGIYGIRAEAPGYKIFEAVANFTESREYNITLLLPDPTPTVTPTPIPTGISVLIVYSYAEERVQLFIPFLKGRGIEADMLHADFLSTTNLDNYSLLIFDTYLGMSQEKWEELAVFVSASKKPVLGIGGTGIWLFKKMGLNIGGSWSGPSIEGIRVVAPQHPIFISPNNLGAVMNQEITLLNTAVWQHGVYLPYIPASVQILGRELNDDDHYPLVMENNFYFVWGFTARPFEMTDEGKNLFENVIHFLASLR